MKAYSEGKDLSMRQNPICDLMDSPSTKQTSAQLEMEDENTVGVFLQQTRHLLKRNRPRRHSQSENHSLVPSHPDYYYSVVSPIFSFYPPLIVHNITVCVHNKESSQGF